MKEREFTEEEQEFIDALDGHACEDCERIKSDVTYAPCPFMSEIHGDETCVWLCDGCRYERAMDI